MSKFKNWLKENWLYVAGGVATAGVIAAAVIKGLKPGDSNSNLLTIDTSKDDWMDSKELVTGWRVKGNPLTVRQSLACAALDNYIYEQMKDKGLLTTNIEADICDKFCEEYSGTSEILDTIDGIWKYTKTEE